MCEIKEKKESGFVFIWVILGNALFDVHRRSGNAICR